MPTARPRINTVLDVQTYAMIAKYADLMETSKSKVVAELLDSVVPHLLPVIHALEKAKEAPDSAKLEIIEAIERSRKALFEALQEAEQGDLYDTNRH